MAGAGAAEAAAQPRRPLTPPPPPNTARPRRPGFGAAGAAGAAGQKPWWYKWLGPKPGARKQTVQTGAVPMRIEPKTFFANERTFLSWLHMSVTIGR